MLDENAIGAYLRALTPEQASNVQSLRRLLHECSPELAEKVSDGKWYKGLLIYASPEIDYTLYALGPLAKGLTTFHMMPYYASTALQEKYSEVLKPFLSGKSCLKFRHYSDLPEAALRGIVAGGATSFATASAALARQQR